MFNFYRAVLLVLLGSIINMDLYSDSFEAEKPKSDQPEASFKVNEEKEKSEDDSEKPLKIGNLSLRASQQPGPLLSFGNHVIDKDEIIIFMQADAFIGNNNYRTDIGPSILYGITDDFSIFLTVLFSPKNKDGLNTSSGIEDIFLQLEYAFYSKNEKSATYESTIVGGISFPSGSGTANPPTGFGSNSFFIGWTYNYTGFDWFYFIGAGVILPMKHHDLRYGKQYLYQFGFGRNICTPPGWIYAWMIEFNGHYFDKRIINRLKDPNSGGNEIFVTPSLWISSNNINFQLGIGSPIVQNLYGSQSKQFLSLIINIGFAF